jgi:hypothetical protein
MSSTALQARDDSWTVMEKVVMNNDLSKLSPQDRVAYVRQLSESLGMNHLTQPFQYITLQGKLTLYATKNAAEQLRRIYGVNIDRVEKEIVNDIYVVTISGHDLHGRHDTDMGAVSIKGLTGDALGTAMMKCLTKAKRRFTLSICGLGFLDESEIEAIPHARPVQVDADGVIQEPTPLREVRPPSTPIVQERAAPLSAPRLKASTAQRAPEPNGADETRRKLVELGNARGVPLTAEMDADAMADLIDACLNALGIPVEVAHPVTARALHNALVALPPRAVDEVTGEVTEGDDDFREVDRLVDMGLAAQAAARGTEE